MAPSAIGNRAICPFGETRSISARLAIQTFRSGPDARLLGRKLRTRGRSESVATSAATPERLSAQTWTFPSRPKPTTQIRPSGPAAMASPRAAAPGIA